MGRKEPLGKVVKKWLGQGKDLKFISNVLKVPVEECDRAYMAYMRGYVSLPQKTNIAEAIIRNKKLHVFGPTGAGKTFSVQNAIRDINISGKKQLTPVVSYARLEEDIIRDFGVYIFQKDVDCVFILEGDNYYWRKYGLVKKMVNESPNPFIIITREKKRVISYISKLLTPIKVQSPSKAEVLKYIKTVDPNWKGDISKMYDSDWRVVLRRLKYGLTSEIKVKRSETIDSKLLSYKIIRGNATLKDFDNCRDPDMFIINWLGWNASNFWSGDRLRHNLSIISWCDANKFNFKKDYIRNTLLQIVPTFVKGFLQFPPYKKNTKKDEKEQPKTIVREHKKAKKDRKKVSKPKKEYKDLSSELGDFLMI